MSIYTQTENAAWRTFPNEDFIGYTTERVQAGTITTIYFDAQISSGYTSFPEVTATKCSQMDGFSVDENPISTLTTRRIYTKFSFVTLSCFTTSNTARCSSRYGYVYSAVSMKSGVLCLTTPTKTSLGVILGSVFGSLALLVLIFMGFFMYKRRNRLPANYMHSVHANPAYVSDPVLISRKDSSVKKFFKSTLRLSSYPKDEVEIANNNPSVLN